MKHNEAVLLFGFFMLIFMVVCAVIALRPFWYAWPAVAYATILSGVGGGIFAMCLEAWNKQEKKRNQPTKEQEAIIKAVGLHLERCMHKEFYDAIEKAAKRRKK